jgi:hypothetical protein
MPMDKPRGTRVALGLAAFLQCGKQNIVSHGLFHELYVWAILGSASQQSPGEQWNGDGPIAFFFRKKF